MVVYLFLAGAADALGPVASARFRPFGYLWMLVLAFCCWRVVRRSWIFRAILLYLSTVALAQAAALQQGWRLQALAALALSLAGLMLLLSPAVYARTHLGSSAAASGIRLRPPRWLVWCPPLSGIAIAGAILPVTHRWYLPGSGCTIAPVQSLPRHCVGVGQGFPVPVVATIRGQHVVNQLALVQDWVQWTVLIFTLSYLLWLALHRRRPPATGRPARGDLVARPSQ
jgi:hypothetical protein